MGSCCIAQGAQLGALWQPRGVGWFGNWEGGSGVRRTYIYFGWFTLLYDRNQHKSVKQLKIKKEKCWIVNFIWVELCFDEATLFFFVKAWCKETAD